MGQCGEKPVQVEFHFLFTLTLKAKGFQDFHPFHNFHMLSWPGGSARQLGTSHATTFASGTIKAAMRIVGCGSGAWPGLGPKTQHSLSVL